MSQVAFVCSHGHVITLEAVPFLFPLHPPAVSAAGEKGRCTVVSKDHCNLKLKPSVELYYSLGLQRIESVSYFLFGCLFVSSSFKIAILNPGS